MTDIQGKKEFLKQVRGMDEVIRCNEQELQALRQLSISISAIDYSKIRVMETVGQGEAKFVKSIEQMIELEEKIQKDTEEMMEVKIQVRNSIQGVEDLEERCILQSKYLLGRTWKEIAEMLHVSVRQVFLIHEKALMKIEL